MLEQEGSQLSVLRRVSVAVLDRDEANTARTTFNSSDRADENNIALPSEVLFDARNALFGPILVAQGG
jgi:hypothetical protein